MASVNGVLLDVTGRPVRLGRELGKGGEGVVFEVDGSSQLVAKVYHQPAEGDKAAKLAAMVRSGGSALTSVAAWPTTTLHHRLGDRVIGVVMNRVHGVEVHRLYSPAHRKAEFPNFDWDKLIVVARNIAAAVARIHDAGHVIGDVNQGNVLVAPTGVVSLIDCDSFQIWDGGRWHPCHVGVAHFTPPELQGKSFRGVTRTQNHDRFGLAVLVFQLLFMGRHPFAGRFLGSGDMPLEQAIREHRFAFGRSAPGMQMAPPPSALPLLSASTAVADLLERAFGRLAPGDARPSAVDWINTLDGLRRSLVACSTNAGHKYLRDLGSSCPWCAIEADGGPDFFATFQSAVHAYTGFDLAKVWAEITAVPAPDTSVPALQLNGNPRPMVRFGPLRRVAWRARAAAYVAAGAWFLFGSALTGGNTLAGAIALWALGLILGKVSGVAAQREARQRELASAEAALRQLEERWKRDVESSGSRFETRLRELTATRAEYLGLDRVKQRDFEVLHAARRDRQLQHYLERFFIDKATIKGIGPALVSTLASYGIETAADVLPSAIRAVPGFGPARVNAICDWRDLLASRFVFDPNRGVDPRDVAAVEHKHARRRHDLERVLAAGPSELRRLRSLALQARRGLHEELERQQRATALARANLAAVS